MAASNQARACRGWSNTAVSEISSWATENAQSKPARRSAQVDHVAGAEPGADAMRGVGIIHGEQAVVQRLELDAGPGQLALGPFVSVAAAPQRIGGVGAQLDERRSPLGVGEVEIPLVGHRRLATPTDMGMTRSVLAVGRIDIAPPSRDPLLGLAHQDQPERPLPGCRVLVGAGDVLLAVAPAETNHLDPARCDQTVQIADQPVMDADQCRRRRDGVALADQELHHSPLILQSRDVTPDSHSVHRLATEAHMISQ